MASESAFPCFFTHVKKCNRELELHRLQVLTVATLVDLSLLHFWQAIRLIGFNILCETIFFFYEMRTLCLVPNQNPLKIAGVDRG